MRKSKITLFGFFIFFSITIVQAGALEDALEDFKLLLYGIALGVVTLILVIHGLRLKIASSPQERDEAKRGIIFVILGLVLIIVAAFLVSLIYKIPEKIEGPTILSANSLRTTGLNPLDNQTAFSFEFENKLSEDIENILVEVYALNYVWCDEDVSKYTFPKIDIIHAGEKRTFSYENFCEGSEKFLIEVKSDKNWWSFCAKCPNVGGDCDIEEGSC